ncbi:bifunctional MaoC family dehydratase N-terminal/OB-fold nucleic acid binding domain-containing protein [Streptomyces thermocarboxydovorans]|uniref:Bifunctional MaoC family dehydratase N-terminal/OB-fold nucleic acid binding domain-containing protein n=1 Tax=Streptomyces thermocarboxydovorans TaxID=59298 RepID=A0ABN1HNA4_9ACTN
MSGEAVASAERGQGLEQDLGARLKAYEGRPAVTGGRGRDPVNEPMIRHWCEAMGDTNPAYAGPGAAAPPTMLQVWTMGGLSGQAARTEAFDELLALLDEAGFTAVVATDCEQEYVRCLRPGDEVTFDAVIESVSDRKITRLGTGHFVTTRMDVRAGGDLVGTHRFRILKYAPAQASRPVRRGPPLSGRRPGQEPGSGPGARPEAHLARRPEPDPARRPEPHPERRPRPVVNRDNAGFWEGVAQHRLLIQRCTGCGTLRFPWLPGCNRCGSLEWDTAEASGEGTVYSYVVMHHPPFPAFDPPYAVGLIELAEGVRMIADVVDVPCDQVRIGMPARLEFRRYDEELVLPVFREVRG